MVFYLIGLGLGDVEDITVKGLNVVRYLSKYPMIPVHHLMILIRLFRRYEILAGADVDDVAVLVVGDPFGATTHTDLVLRAKQKAIPVSQEYRHSLSLNTLL
ncbi:unnamed protein product [Angiostrongylus costaricensis]|uniref:Diphthine synthase n=1 Tax=Angiostrongylus costaricensis TaxID=334426 RepID=A0A0R3PV37_ANGCS|nr:unnamed protein product [Angiostrongylus costaricensis]